MPDLPGTDVPNQLAYTDDTVKLVARALAPDYPGAGEDDYYRDDATRALDALAAAGWLVPPRSGFRVDWSVAFGPDDAMDCSNEAAARRMAERDGGTVESRRVITTPWSRADQPVPLEDR